MVGANVVVKWLKKAACSSSDPSLWFSQELDDIEVALSICGRCSAVEECREANKDEPFGVFGGTTARERIGACAVPTKNFPDGRTGTRAGYFEHIRKHEKPCSGCSLGNAEYQSARVNAGKERVK